MNLSPHFTRKEFESRCAIPDDAIPAFIALCQSILEPIRERFQQPITITSGYRTPKYNAKIGGAENSQHVATVFNCAADFTMVNDLCFVFDWIRLHSGLMFDQVILEREEEASPPACIHVSWRHKDPRRDALIGLTRNRSKYIRVPVNPPFPTHDLTSEIWGES